MITPEQLQTIASSIKSQTLDESLVIHLRSQYPDIHFTYCLDDDISTGKASFEGEGFNLYLIDGREHCLCLTQNHEHATGIVVAEVIED